MYKPLSALAVGLLVAACGYVDRYEEGVYAYEPTYCYKSIGTVRCYREPFHRDQRRLVNYYGPHPSRYDTPPPPPALVLKAPPPVAFYVRDPEPVPEPVRPRRAGASIEPRTEPQAAATDLEVDLGATTTAPVAAPQAPVPLAAPLTPVERIDDAAVL
jgi:hypothetical protein